MLRIENTVIDGFSQFPLPLYIIGSVFEASVSDVRRFPIIYHF